MSRDWFADVLEFHRKFGCAVGTTPGTPDEATRILRGNLIEEEISELTKAGQANDLPGIADALADLIYVLIGTAVAYGIDLRPVWDAVQVANMAKHPTEKWPDGKVMKGRGWTPPDIAGILAEQGPIR